jgi:hypothetical protein
MRIQDGVLRNMTPRGSGLPIDNNVNTAIKACVIKVPIIGESILATIEQDSYM